MITQLTDCLNAKTTATQTLNEELAERSFVQSYDVPCEPALMELTTEGLVSSWTT